MGRTCLWDCKNVSEQKVQPNDTQGWKKNINQVIIINYNWEMIQYQVADQNYDSGVVLP